MTNNPQNTTEPKDTAAKRTNEWNEGPMKHDEKSRDNSASWKMIKEDIRKSWSSISEEELEGTSGDRREIVNLLQKKNGKGIDDYNRKIDYIFAKHEDPKKQGLGHETTTENFGKFQPEGAV